MSGGAVRPRRRKKADRRVILPVPIRTAPGWQACPTCPPDDNVWPESAFRAWGQVRDGSRPKTPICGACIFDRYPKVYRPCATCGGPMHAGGGRMQHVEHPQCYSCRRSDEPTCARCKETTAGRQVVGEHCLGCHLREPAESDSDARRAA